MHTTTSGGPAQKANPPEVIFHSFVISLTEKTDSTAAGYPLIVLPFIIYSASISYSYMFNISNRSTYFRMGMPAC